MAMLRVFIINMLRVFSTNLFRMSSTGMFRMSSMIKLLSADMLEASQRPEVVIFEVGPKFALLEGPRTTFLRPGRNSRC